MMADTATLPARSYDTTRVALEEYFDRTAQKAWLDLTSDAKVSGIRATVRAGRDRMRATLIGWLPDDLRGARLLDAGCGTGALAVEAARRGADVVAIDIARGLVDAARTRTPDGLMIDWRVGDFADPALGRFDYTVAMDSLIHYRADDLVTAVTGLADRSAAVAFTFAPRTPALTLMHTAGRLFPRSDRAPAIQPVSENHLRRALAAALPGASLNAGARIASGFYTSHALMVAAA